MQDTNDGLGRLRRPEPPAERRYGAVVRLAIAVAVTVAVVAAAHRLTRPPSATTAAARPPAARPTSTTSTMAGRVWPSTTTTLDYHDGILTTAAGRFSVGEAGDVAAAVDLNCDGVESLVVLQRASGDVVVFHRWPEADEALTGERLTTVDGGVQLVVDSRRRCPTLAVVDVRGERHLVAT